MPIVLNENNLLSLVYDWKNFCKLDSRLYPIIPLDKYERMLENLFSHLESLILDPVYGIYSKRLNSEKWVKVLDLQMEYFRLTLIDSVRINSKSNAWKLPIKLGKKTSGIGIDAFIRRTETETIDFKNTQQNLLQIKDADKNTPKRIKSLFSQLSFIQTSTKNAVMGQELKHRRDYHAELLWMVFQGEDFVKKIKMLASNTPLSKSDVHHMDQNWMLHFVTYPRIEFVLSSSCCMVCQQYFKDLRHHLNQNNIFVPIVIYSGMPTNNEEIHKSQMNLILFDGSFISTGIYIETAYDSKVDRKAPDFFKPIDLKRAEACEEVIGEAIAYVNVRDDEYQMKLISSLDQIFLKDEFKNQADLAWLRSFLLRWPHSFYAEQKELYEQFIEKIEKNFVSTNPINIPSIESLKQQIKAQVRLLLQEEFEDENIEDYINETIDETLNESSLSSFMWSGVLHMVFFLVIYLVVQQVKQRCLESQAPKLESL